MFAQNKLSKINVKKAQKIFKKGNKNNYTNGDWR